MSGYVKDTIAAIATAPGRAGIGVIRVSGPDVPEITKTLLGQIPEPRYARLASFESAEGETIDQGIGLYFREPASFTGEHVLELQGHGGPVVLDLLLNRVLELGARVAEPGEFSKRAYLNDKLDLAQAEAISDLINSSTSQAARGAMRSLDGRFSEMISDLTAEVIELRVYVEAALDFPEEEVDFLNDDNVETRLENITIHLQSILEQANVGALLTEGASVVLLGKPNAGKSSLMNHLTGRDTSIVTDVPGTTRDIVDEQLHLDGIPLKLIDTAGIRESGDDIEAEGMRRAFAAAERADLVIALVDVSEPDPEATLAELVSRTTVPTIDVFNKTDLLPEYQVPDSIVGVSARTGSGIDALKDALKIRLGVEMTVESGFTARTRHVSALKRALAAVGRGKTELQTNSAGEILAEELKHCQASLSEITGEFTADDLLGEIFSSFCIGK